jgi:hypothetical protein
LFALSILLTASARAGTVYSEGFESYTAGAALHGQVTGGTTWSSSGVIAGDQAHISGAQAQSGSRSVLFADNGSNRPRSTVNFVSGGFIPAALQAGTVEFWLKEDTSDGTTADQWRVNAGDIQLQRDATKMYFSIAGGGGRNVFLSGTGYTYTAGAWNRFEIVFDNAAKQADLYINGGLVGPITGASANFAVGALTIGTYASTSTGDWVYFDELALIQPGDTFAVDFEAYAIGNITGQAIGAATWTTAGVLTGDLAQVVADHAADGVKSLVIADNGANRPRVSANLVNAGFIPAASGQGELSFALMEDPADGGAGDQFTFNLGTLTLQHGSGTTLSFSVTGGVHNITAPFVTDTYTYVPGQWNDIRVRFEDSLQWAKLFINGGYAGMLAMPPGSTTPFTMGSLTFANYSSGAVGDKVYVDSLAGEFNAPEPVPAWRSSLYPATWTPGYADADGRFLHDFSYAGYKMGATAIPTVSGPNYVTATAAPYNADATGASDSTAAIQAALDYVGANGGGVVYLPAGTYKVNPANGSGTIALQIKYSNVVLRGAGTGQTFIVNTATAMHDKRVIAVRSAAPISWFEDGTGTNTTALSANLPGPTTQIPVTSTTGFAVGDLIMVRNNMTAAFIAEIGMTGYSGWSSTGNLQGRVVCFARRITAINTTTKVLTVDVPTRFPLLLRDSARVTRPTKAMLKEVGLEDFSIGMVQHPSTTFVGTEYNTAGTAAYDVGGSIAILVEGTENSWVRRVNTFKPAGNDAAHGNIHLLSNGLKLLNSRLTTVEDCSLGFAQFKGEGGNGYILIFEGQEALARNCTVEGGRHNLSFNKMHCNGNVLHNVLTKNGQYASDFHQYLSLANLLDNVSFDGDLIETIFRGSAGSPAQGITSSQSVFWNSNGIRYATRADGTGNNSFGADQLSIVSSDQHDRGYVIGTRGPAHAVRSTDFVEGVGTGDGLSPQSLYLDQRLKRLGF